MDAGCCGNRCVLWKLGSHRGTASASRRQYTLSAPAAQQAAYSAHSLGAPSEDSREAKARASMLAKQRAELAHFLRDSVRSPDDCTRALDEFGRYLRMAVAELSSKGSTDLQLDKNVINNYLESEDKFIGHKLSALSHAGLNDTLDRLSLILQNMHHLMVHTEEHVFQFVIRDLFARFFYVCHHCCNVERARPAWNSLVAAGHTAVLNDFEICLDYVNTLLKFRRRGNIVDKDTLVEGLKLLKTWSVSHSRNALPLRRPTDQRTVAGVTKQRALAQTFHQAIRSSLAMCEVRQADIEVPIDAIKSFQKLRERSGTPPEFLVLNLTTSLAALNVLNKSMVTPRWTKEAKLELLYLVLDDLALSIAHEQKRFMYGSPRLLLDEGTALRTLNMCCKARSGLAAQRTFDVLCMALRKLPVPPPAQRASRPTTLTGRRVPCISAYHTVIHAHCVDTLAEPRDSLQGAFSMLARLETDYALLREQTGRDLDALCPIRMLTVMTDSIGASQAAWLAAWQLLKQRDLDPSTPVTPAQVNVLMAALARLPPAMDAEGQVVPLSQEPGPPEGEDVTVDILAQPGVHHVTKAVELHAMLDKGFGDLVGVHTYNALLSVFCASVDTETMPLILNLMELMRDKGVENNYETFVLLLQHFDSTKAYGAFLATVEDMQAMKLQPPVRLITTAMYAAEEADMTQEAAALAEALRKSTPYDNDRRPRHNSYHQRNSHLSGSQYNTSRRPSPRYTGPSYDDRGRATSRPEVINHGPWSKGAT